MNEYPCGASQCHKPSVYYALGNKARWEHLCKTHYDLLSTGQQAFYSKAISTSTNRCMVIRIVEGPNGDPKEQRCVRDRHDDQNHQYRLPCR